MNLDQRIEAFVSLGTLFKAVITSFDQNNEALENPFIESFRMQISRAHETNGWFTKKNVLTAFDNWANSLEKENLTNWLKKYNLDQVTRPKKVGIVMAGNIPLVGFHDFLSVLLTGHHALVKLSSNDKQFIPLVAAYLSSIDPWFKTAIQFTTDNLNDFDAVIATGSNNTARYFEHYFGKYPSIIRRNRNGVAILSGTESKSDLELLGEDIFLYFGLGCRSVSKLFVPTGYDFDQLFEALFKFKEVINYKKYENNYDYNKAVYLMSSFDLLENGFLMLKEDNSYGSPIATLFYEYYDNTDELRMKLSENTDKIQCIVSNEKLVNIVNFGHSQRPKLWNYADDVDTVEFLLKI